MKKDFYKTHKKKSRARWHWVALFIFFSLVGIGGTIFLVNYKKNPAALIAAISPYTENVESWIEERKKRFNNKLAKVKRVTVNENDPNPPIHFEFYTTLPNMQVQAATPLENKNIKELVKAPLPKEIVKKEIVKNEMVKKEIVKNEIVKNEIVKIETPKTSIFDPEGIQQAFGEEINKASDYVLQLGVFTSVSAADEYRVSLNDLGLMPEVVTRNLKDKSVFYVQLGPFENKNQAKLTQVNLQKKNIVSIIRRQE